MFELNKLLQFQYTCLQADIDAKDIWLGTKSELKLYNAESHFWERFDASHTNKLLNDEIKEIAIGQNFVCVLTERGINLFNKEDKSWKRLEVFDTKVTGTINSMLMHENLLLIGTEGIISVYDIDGDGWSYWYLPNKFREDPVSIIIQIKDSIFGLTTQNNLLIYDAEKSEFIIEKEFESEINCLSYNEKMNHVWIGLPNGIKCIDLGKKELLSKIELKPRTGDAPNITNILSNDNFVFALGGENLFKLKLSKLTEPSTKDDTEASSSESALWKQIELIEPGYKGSEDFEIIGATLDSEWLWIATKAHGVIEHEFDYNNINKYLPDVLADNDIHFHYFAALAEAFILIGDDSIWNFDKETTTWHQFFQPFIVYPKETEQIGGKGVLIRDLCSIDDEELWFIESESEGDKTGKVNSLIPNPPNGKIEPVPVEISGAFKMREVKDEVWLCCTRKLVKYSRKDDAWKFYTMNIDFDIDEAKTIGYSVNETDTWEEPDDYDAYNQCFTLNKDNLWVGMKTVRNPYDKSTKFTLFGGGVLVLDKDSNKWDWALKDKLLSNDINSIGRVDDSMWLGTDKGINIYSTKNGKLKNLTDKEGLPYNDIELIEATKDTVWVSTPRDFYWYEKDKDRWVRFNQDDLDNMFFEYYKPKEKTWVFLKDAENIEQGRKILTIEPINDKIFFGSQMGLIVHDPKQDTWRSCSLEEGLSNVDVTSVTVHDNYIIVGTLNGIFISKQEGA